MTRTTHTIRRAFRAFALVASVAAVAIPAATAGTSYDPGIVARTLGSPDRAGTAQVTVVAPGIVASTLGSADSRDTAGTALFSPSMVASRLGSPDRFSRASQPVFSAGMIGRLGAPDPRGVLESSQQASTVDTHQSSVDWGKVGIGIGVALGAILLLGALGLGARQARHGRQRLGSA